MRRARPAALLAFVAVPLTVVVAAAVLAACVPPNPPANCAPTGVTTQRNLRYASSPGTTAVMQSLDLYTPVRPAGCAATPVVVYVHGGGFRNGDKANQITDKVNLFTHEGWAFASVNYRLVGDARSGPTNGVYPAAEQDVAAAVNLLTRTATANRIDPHKAMLLGHSAGAFLVSLESTDGSFLQTAGTPLTDVRCTASLDTTYDIPAQVAAGGDNALMYLLAFGTDPAVWANGSPTHHVVADTGIPSFHVVTRGLPDRTGQAQAFGAQLRAAGVPADVQVATGLSHEAVNDAVGRAGDTVITPPLMSFYRACAR